MAETAKGSLGILARKGERPGFLDTEGADEKRRVLMAKLVEAEILDQGSKMCLAARRGPDTVHNQVATSDETKKARRSGSSCTDLSQVF